MILLFEKHLLVHVLSFASHWTIVQASKWCRESRKIVKEAFPSFLQVKKKQNLNDNLNEFCKEGNFGGVYYLVSMGVNVHKNKEKALITACCANQVEIAEFLVSKGANPKKYTRFSKTLSKSIENSKYEISQLLVSCGVGFIVHKNFYDPSLDVELFVGMGVKFGADYLLKKFPSVEFFWKSESYMIHAAEAGNLELVKFLIQQGNSNYSEGLTGACRSGNVELVDFLLKFVPIKNLKFQTEIAFRLGYIDMVHLLCKKIQVQNLWHIYLSCDQKTHERKKQVKDYLLKNSDDECLKFVFRAHCKDGDLTSLEKWYKLEFSITESSNDIELKSPYVFPHVWLIDGMKYALQNGHLSIVKFLFDKIKCHHVYAEKWFVYSFCNLEIVKFLISKGLNLPKHLSEILTYFCSATYQRLNGLENFLSFVFSTYPTLDREKILADPLQKCLNSIYFSRGKIVLLCFFGANVSECSWNWVFEILTQKCLQVGHFMRLFGFEPSKSDIQIFIDYFYVNGPKCAYEYFFALKKTDTLNVYQRFKIAK